MPWIQTCTCCCKCLCIYHILAWITSQFGDRTASTSNQFTIYDQRMPGMRGIVLDFGWKESENLSRYIRPDWHQNGYMVACGSQSESKVHFWYVFFHGFLSTLQLTYGSLGIYVIVGWIEDHALALIFKALLNQGYWHLSLSPIKTH